MEIFLFLDLVFTFSCGEIPLYSHKGVVTGTPPYSFPH